MNIAHGIRQLRYAKGWGPDELASRAHISRTTLYHIESGRTELPRAATLRRIARALGVAPERFLKQLGVESEVRESPTPSAAPPCPAPPREPDDDLMDLAQEIEIERKFRLLLRSTLRDAMIRIVEESYQLQPWPAGEARR